MTREMMNERSIRGEQAWMSQERPKLGWIEVGAGMGGMVDGATIR